MLEYLPKRALFQFEFPLHHKANLGPIDADLSKWPLEYLLPPLVELEDREAFADVYAAWHADALALAFDVPGRRGPLRCDERHWWKGDGVRICVDTRDARDNKRATRYCHFFYVLPMGGGAKGRSPLVGFHRMNRAKEPPAPVDPTRVKAASLVRRDGWSLEVLIPATCLHGWDPAEHPRIGLFYKIKDTAQGGQHLSADDELGWNVDPSTWATAVLNRG